MPIKPNTSDSLQQMDDVALRRKRGTLIRQLNQFVKFIDEAGESESYDPVEIKIRVQTIESQWTQLVEIQGELEERDESEIANAETTQRHYFSARARAERLLHKNQEADNPRKLTDSSPTTTKCASVMTKLPELRLPTFDGTIENWPSFFNSFTSRIDHHEGLSPVQKLEYLRAALTGKAASCIQSLATTDANYASAIDILKRKFSNKRRILVRLCEALINLPKIKKNCPTQIGEFVTLFNQRLCAIENLGEPIASWNTMLITIITSKLNPDILMSWESTLKDKEVPPYTELIEFLETRADCTPPPAEGTTSTSKGYTKQRHVFFTNAQCPICEGNHPVMRCQQFRSQPIHERLKSVKKAALCTNCLQTGHSIQNCNSGACRICNKRHNTLLHQPSGEEKRNPPDSSVSTKGDDTPATM